MTTEPEALKSTKPAKSLTKVIAQSERVKDMVEECADELSSVNISLKQELADREPLPVVENALQKSETIEIKVQEAVEELSAVNQALENEVRERQLLEHQLAAAQEQEKAARYAAFHDPLTGLPNRVLFNDRLEHGLEQAKRHGWTLALMFVDLNDFKDINDSYGHDVGDSVLREIAGRLKGNTRGDDTVSRHGGDEFLYLLMESMDERDITLVVEKIVKAIQLPIQLPTQLPPLPDISVGERTISVSISASIGIAIFPKDGTTMDSLIKSADQAMYQAKRTKTRYAFGS